MTARSAQHEAEWFTSPQQVNQRRYEALRAYFVDRLSYAQAGARFGYTRWAMINLVREHRAGKLELFAPPRKPGPAPGTAPAKDRARGRVIELRRQGLSSYEISRRLTSRGHPAEPHLGRGDPRRGGVRAAAAAPGARGQHLPGHSRPRHELAGRDGHRLQYLAGPAGQHPGRAAARRPGPGVPGPARPGRGGRLPRHPGHPRHLLAAVPAGAQAHPHPAGLPRR